jgi:hypothetical protein
MAKPPPWVQASTGLKGLPRAVWEGAPAEWIAALQAIDQRQDKGPLLRLLLSEKPMPRAVRYHLADLLERYNLKRPPRAQRQPSYDMTMQNQRLDLARTAVRERPRGMTVKAAIKAFSKQYGMEESALETACGGHHKSLEAALRRARVGTDAERFAKMKDRASD